MWWSSAFCSTEVGAAGQDPCPAFGKQTTNLSQIELETASHHSVHSPLVPTFYSRYFLRNM